MFQSFWRELDALLVQHQAYWRFLPFYQAKPAWHYPELEVALSALSDAELAELEQNESLRQTIFSHYFPALACVDRWLSQQPLPVAEVPAMPFWLSRDIKGRKLKQIEAWVAQLPNLPLPVLEWCAGKGHLGRWLSYSHQREVQSLEWQGALCQEGAEIAAQFALPQHFLEADAFSVSSALLLKQDQHAIALHACGDLHLQLMRLASEQGTRQLDVVPCCYHLMQQKEYTGLSSEAQQSDLLPLSKDELKLAVQSQSTAGERVAKLRYLEVWWRLSYQALYQDYCKDEGYRPLSSVSKHWFSGEFKAFAEFAAAEHGWALPTDLDVTPFLAKGKVRQLEVRKQQLVRSLFRPALELFLVLDRALYLQQQGYRVSLRRFCNAELTPRHWWLSASKP